MVSEAFPARSHEENERICLNEGDMRRVSFDIKEITSEGQIFQARNLSHQLVQVLHIFLMLADIRFVIRSGAGKEHWIFTYVQPVAFF